MTADRHPSTQQLSAYAAGFISPGAALAIAAHLTYCSACREQVRRGEMLLAALAEEDGVAAPNTVPAPPPLQSELRHDAGPLPQVVADAVGMDFDDIPWRFLLPGVHEHVIDEVDGEEISLLRVRPGKAIPRHTHEGEELTLVLSGALCDDDVIFGPGDLAIADPSVDHHPRAGGDQTCICLAVMSGGVTFTGRFGRALNLFNRA